MLTATLPTAPTIAFRAVFPGRRLTDKQSRMLLLIAQFSALHHHPPSIREMMTTLGYTSPAPVQEMALRLRSMGALDWQDGQARTFNLSKQIQFQAVVLKYRIRFTSGYYSESEARTDNPEEATLFNIRSEAQNFAAGSRERYSIELVELDLAAEERS